MTTTSLPVKANQTPVAPAGRGRRTGASRYSRSALLFLTPFGLLFVTLMLAPIGYALYQSLFKVERSGLGLGSARTTFVGVSNYLTALQDGEFTASLLRVVLIGMIQVPLMQFLALLLALLLDSAVARLKRTFRLVYFLPYALPGVSAAIMWSFLYQPSISPITSALGFFGVQADLLSGNLVYVAIINMMTWSYTGFTMLVLYSALQAIPPELGEAGRVDGCGEWRVAWHIKIPAVRPALILTSVFSIIGTAQLYNDPQILHQVSPAIGSSFTPIMAVQDSAAANNYNLAAAQSIILALLTFVLSFGVLKFTQRRERLS
jgi:multiple sugar transport system permease protein